MDYEPSAEYNQNIYQGITETVYVEDIVRTWYNEISHYSFNDPFISARTQHFAQMIWKSTREIGVGMIIRYYIYKIKVM